jgi:serine/threonine protein kinase
MRARDSRKILREGKRLGLFSVVRLIGQGGFGDIYEAFNTIDSMCYAMKVERITPRRASLKRESSITQLVGSSPFFPQFVCYAETPKYRYLVMELCGPSFSSLRRFLPGHTFSISTVLRVGYEMLRAIEAFHGFGLVHRDIKPSNFLIRPSHKHPVALIDYGLGRPYMDPVTQELIRERVNPGFCGTSKYASINAHAGKELGRRDDLFSWFYAVVEMWQGSLPWHGMRDRDEVCEVKRTIEVGRLIRGMPAPMSNIWRLIRKLQRAEDPDYGLLKASLAQAMAETGTRWDDPYDWEEYDTSRISPISLIPPDDDESHSSDGFRLAYNRRPLTAPLGLRVAPGRIVVPDRNTRFVVRRGTLPI